VLLLLALTQLALRPRPLASTLLARALTADHADIPFGFPFFATVFFETVFFAAFFLAAAFAMARPPRGSPR
jgi:hypothetical protein